VVRVSAHALALEGAGDVVGVGAGGDVDDARAAVEEAAGGGEREEDEKLKK
jgi:hypothetical protein